ncbi:MAG: hypothetical protein IPK22_17825 [Verrucomicrobiaceae bacterium]|nr:hypothetical protein [Verrucomicrobiaceae bacterium]
MKTSTKNFLKWLFFVGCLSIIGWLVNRRASSNHGVWFMSSVEAGRVKHIGSNLSPEAAAKHFGFDQHHPEEVILKLDCDLSFFIISSKLERLESIPSNSRDSWGHRYYGIFDFNNDGHVPNPETLTTHPHPGTPATLKRRTAIFSAGPDGDPVTWEDNIKNW